MADGPIPAPGGAPDGGAPAPAPAPGNDKSIFSQSGNDTPPVPAGPQGEEFLKLFGEAGKTGLFQGVNTPDELVKRMADLKGRADNSGLKIPGENATPEEREAFHKALGRPDAPEGYELGDKGIDPASGIQLDPDLKDWSAKTFHALGLPKETAQKLNEAWNERISRQAVANREALAKMGETTTNELKQFYGESNFQAGMGQMRNAVRAIAGEDADAFEALLARPDVGNDPLVMRVMARMGQFWGKAVGEEGMKLGAGAGIGSVVSVAEAKSKVASIMGDKNDAYWDKRHPNNAARVKEVADLYKVIQDGGVK